MRRKFIVPALLATPALILSPQSIATLEKAGFMQPSLALEKRLPLNMVSRTRRVARRLSAATTFAKLVGTGTTTLNTTNLEVNDIDLTTGLAGNVSIAVFVAARPVSGNYFHPETIEYVNSVGRYSLQNAVATTGQSNGGCGIYFLSGNVPTGFDGDREVAISFAATQQCIGAAVYALSGFGESIILNDTAQGTGDLPNLSVDVGAGGSVIVGGCQTGTGTATISGVNEEDFDDVIETSVLRYAGGNYSGPAQTNRTFSIDWSGTVENARGVSASFAIG